MELIENTGKTFHHFVDEFITSRNAIVFLYHKKHGDILTSLPELKPIL
jgi:hypothetical protein